MVSKEEVREDLRITRKWTYLDNAATSPMRDSVLEEIHRWYRDAGENGDMNYEKYLEKLEECRESIAEFMRVDRDSIAFLKNTSEGINLSLLMLKEWGKRENRDTFVTTDHGYGVSLQYPSMDERKVQGGKEQGLPARYRGILKKTLMKEQ